jgi:hypothetical protein
VQCSPAEGHKIFEDIKIDFPEKQIVILDRKAFLRKIESLLNEVGVCVVH